MEEFRRVLDEVHEAVDPKEEHKNMAVGTRRKESTEAGTRKRSTAAARKSTLTPRKRRTLRSTATPRKRMTPRRSGTRMKNMTN